MHPLFAFRQGPKGGLSQGDGFNFHKYFLRQSGYLHGGPSRFHISKILPVNLVKRREIVQIGQVDSGFSTLARLLPAAPRIAVMFCITCLV